MLGDSLAVFQIHLQLEESLFSVHLDANVVQVCTAALCVGGGGSALSKKAVTTFFGDLLHLPGQPVKTQWCPNVQYSGLHYPPRESRICSLTSYALVHI